MDWFVKKTIRNILASVVGMAAINAFLNLEEPLRFVKTASLYFFSSLLIGVVVFAAICYLRYFIPLRKKEPGFPFVYVNLDGTVRELSESEEEYLKMEFHPTDGGRPYIKNRYNDKTGSGRIAGFIYRDRVPRTIMISSDSVQVNS